MTLAGAGLTSTLKFTPASAELVPVKGVVLVVRLTSVRRPITADGRMTNTLPLPLLVLMPTLNPPTHKSLPWPVHATVPSGWRAQLLSQSCPPMIWPPGVPPPAKKTDIAFDQWSRPVSLLICGVRPNSPRAMTIVESSRPR